MYLQLTRLGYAVPLPYLLDVLCLNNCADHAADRISYVRIIGNTFLNYDKQIIQLIGLSKNDKNKIDIDELYQIVKKGTEVEIIQEKRITVG